jgi:hypothetical protein
MNNKGFMMAEVVVVSAVILLTLTGFYVSYNKILATYNQRINYYDIKTLYLLANYRETSIDNTTSPSYTIPIINSNEEKIYYINKNDLENVKKQNINPTFKDYITYLSGSLDLNNLKKADGTDIENLLVMERCNSDGKTNCKYAYLEVYY